MTEPIPMGDAGGAAAPAPAPATPEITDAATRVAKYATDGPQLERWNPADVQPVPEVAPVAEAAPPPVEASPQQWLSEDDPEFQQLVDDELRARLQAAGLIDYGPGELEVQLDEFDRASRVEQFELAVETHDAMAAMVRDWYPDLQVDPDAVINGAAEMFQAAENVGYRLSAEQAMEMVRTVAEQHAELARAEGRIGQQIEREGQVFSLLSGERMTVRDLAEELLPAVARRNGGAFDAVTAREAVSEAARLVAGRPGRQVESSRERVYRFAREAEARRGQGYSPHAWRAAVIEQRNASMKEVQR
jgi:hypothetical protein